MTYTARANRHLGVVMLAHDKNRSLLKNLVAIQSWLVNINEASKGILPFQHPKIAEVIRLCETLPKYE